MEKLKVLFVSAANSTHTVKWVNSLSEYFEVHLVYCKNHTPDIDNIKKEVFLHELNFKAPFGYYLNAIKLKRIFKKIKPDIVNAHYASGYGTLVRMAKIIPVLLSVWGSDVYDFPNESKLKRRIFEKNIMYAQYLASTSNIMAEELKKQVPKLNKAIYITPFGVNIEKFKKTNKTDTSKELKIGNIKTLDNDTYGIDYGILAFKKLKEKLINNNEQDLANKLKLYIYGDGKDKKQIEDLIISKKLENAVFLMGRVPNEDVPYILNGLDIFCVTSNKESFGVSIVEAMSCEVPVVATDADGFCEVIENNKTGYIVEKRNINAIAEALENLVKDKKIREEFGKNGRNRVLEKYNWIENVETMKKIYIDIINKKNNTV